MEQELLPQQLDLHGQSNLRGRNFKRLHPLKQVVKGGCSSRCSSSKNIQHSSKNGSSSRPALILSIQASALH